MNLLRVKTSKMASLRYAGVGMLVLAAFYLLHSQTLKPVEVQYYKKEFRIPMRDGTRLFTAVYGPRDNSRSYPILLNRTPYGISPYGEDSYPPSLGPSKELEQEGFIFVYQDVRGRMMSDGEFINVPPYKTIKTGPRDVDESTDAYDTIEWLVRNIPNNNGRVGMWGISYPGFYAASGLIDAHPALKAVSPQAPIADWFIGDDFHHNGAFFLAHAFGFLSSFGYPRNKTINHPEVPFNFPTLDGYEFYLNMGPLAEANRQYLKNKNPFWNDLMAHGSYDKFWQARNLRPHLKNIRPAVMTVGGWFDAEDLFGSLGVYQSIEASTPDAYNILVMGPWYHGGWVWNGDRFGEISFDSDTSAYYRKEIEFPFFMRFLKESATPDLPEASVFLTGTNKWQKEAHWPPLAAKALSLHLCAGGKLSWEACPENAKGEFDEYLSDPEKPVPYIEDIATNMQREYMVSDQRFASRRTDVLTYATEGLPDDLTIAGPIIANLSISSTGTDADFVVKLIDAYPDDYEECTLRGYQQLVRGEPFRAKFRDSFSSPKPLIPGQIAKIEYSMPDIFHTFRKGHRLMVQVQSSWFPLVDRNPQQFIDIYQAKAGDFKKAIQRVHHSKTAPSFLTLRKME
jgi:putative CocE/NonD family hydrolase